MAYLATCMTLFAIMPLFSAQHHTVTYQWRIEFCGECRFDLQPTNHLHWHDYYEICLITGGQGEYRWREESYAIGKGDVILTGPEDPHEICSFETRDLRLIFFRFWIELRPDPPNPQDPIDQLLTAFLAGWKPKVTAPYALAYVPLLESTRHTMGVASFAVQQLLWPMLTDLLGALTPGLSLEAGMNGWPDAMSRASAYIDSQVHVRHPTVPEVAQHAGVSTRTLNRLFQEHVSHSPLREIHERRLQYAAQKLAMRFGVAEVAEMMQFESPSAFSRLFKRHFGMSPLSYQRANAPSAPLHRTRFQD